MADGPLLEIADLTFRYQRATEPAIRDVTLGLAPGEVLLVAGPSGCGKSTLIRAINGLIPHAYRGELAGSVRLLGRSTTDLRLREIALSVGTLLQDPAKQIVGSTVEAELAFGPENLAWSPIEMRRRISEVIAEAGIEPLAGRETFALSGGERQLLAMAGALMLRPKLYVVDEPLANLDPATARRLLAALRTLADAGHGVVIVEHRVEEALELRPDRVLYLDAGSVAYLGPVDGFLGIADPEAVKLPFEIVLERARSEAGAGSAEAAVRRPVAPDDPSRLAFSDVRVRLGEREVLTGLTADLRSHEVVAVLGPNGSGKTTMFRAGMGLIRPSGGQVAVNGQPIGKRTVADLVAKVARPEEQLVAHGPGEEHLARALEDVTEDPRQVRHRALADRLAIHRHLAAARPDQPHPGAEHRRLARAVRAEHRDHLV